MAENQGKDGNGRKGAREAHAHERNLASELGTVEQNLLLRVQDFDDPRQEQKDADASGHRPGKIVRPSA
jgi:aquaporin Z